MHCKVRHPRIYSKNEERCWSWAVRKFLYQDWPCAIQQTSVWANLLGIVEQNGISGQVKYSWGERLINKAWYFKTKYHWIKSCGFSSAWLRSHWLSGKISFTSLLWEVVTFPTSKPASWYLPPWKQASFYSILCYFYELLSHSSFQGFIQGRKRETIGIHKKGNTPPCYLAFI